MPLKAVKGQVVADFIVDHSTNEESINYLEIEPWKLYFDGSSHKDGTGVRVLIISPSTRSKVLVRTMRLNTKL